MLAWNVHKLHQRRFACLLALVCCAGSAVYAQRFRDIALAYNKTLFMKTLYDDNNLFAIIDDANFEGIVLAPSNAALNSSLLPLLIPDQIRRLRYHILPFAFLPNADNVPVWPSDLGSQFNVTIYNSALPGDDAYYFYGAVAQAGSTGPAKAFTGKAKKQDCIGFNYQSMLCTIDGVLEIPDGPNNSVYAIIASRPDLSMLKQIVDSSPDLKSAVKDVDSVGTIFAPNNDAISAALTLAGGWTLDGLLAVPAVRDAMFYTVLGHACDGPRLWSTAIGNGSFKYNNTFGSDLIVTTTDGSSTVTTSNNTAIQAKVVVSDVAAGKSWVHIIDQVLDAGVAIPVLPQPSPEASPYINASPPVQANGESGTVQPAPSPPNAAGHVAFQPLLAAAVAAAALLLVMA